MGTINCLDNVKNTLSVFVLQLIWSQTQLLFGRLYCFGRVLQFSLMPLQSREKAWVEKIKQFLNAIVYSKQIHPLNSCAFKLASAKYVFPLFFIATFKHKSMNHVLPTL